MYRYIVNYKYHIKFSFMTNFGFLETEGPRNMSEVLYFL